MLSIHPFVIVALIVTSQSVYNQIVVRRQNGDLFTPKPWDTCEDANATPYNATVCQCPVNKTTVVFFLSDYKCVANINQSLIDFFFSTNSSTILYINKFSNNNVFTLQWSRTNLSWPADDLKVYTSNGSLFTGCTPYHETFENTASDSFASVTQKIFKRKPGVKGVVLLIDPNVIYDRKMLQGRLFMTRFTCFDGSLKNFGAFVKFDGHKNYANIKTSTTSSPYTTYGTDYTPDTTETTDNTPSSPDLTVFRSVNGDGYQYEGTYDKQCSRNPPMTFMPMSNGYIECGSTSNIENWYSNLKTPNRMLYINSFIDIFTLSYIAKQKKWSQHPTNQITFQNSDNLTSQDCYQDHVKIKSIFMVTYKGWERWVGNDKDYFVLIRAPDTDRYTIKFEYEHDYNSFAGQLLDIRMECQDSPLYHLYVKFEGSRKYYKDFDVNTIKPTKFPLTTPPSTTKTQPTPPPQNDKILIISVVIASVVLLILITVVCFFVVIPKWRRRHQQNSWENNLKKEGSSTDPWSKSAQDSLNVPTDPKQKEAEEILELAKEIISERKNQKKTPDVIPTYIKNRPAPKCQDPRPAVGPLSGKENYYVLGNTNEINASDYIVLKDANKYVEMSGLNQAGGQSENEGAYLDLDEVKCSAYQELDTSMIKPDSYC